MEDNLLKDLLLGFIKVHILHYAAKKCIYGQEFFNELRKHGYRISYGTLYPMFHRMEKEGYLKSEKKNAEGRTRRYYTITKEGKRILKRAKLQANELVEELYGE